MMTDLVGRVRGKTDKITIDDEQRVVIETAHGLISIVARLDRSHGRRVALEITHPPTMHLRKGPIEELSLLLQYLEVHGEDVAPAFRILAVHQISDGGFVLKEPKALVVG